LQESNDILASLDISPSIWITFNKSSSKSHAQEGVILKIIKNSYSFFKIFSIKLKGNPIIVNFSNINTPLNVKFRTKQESKALINPSFKTIKISFDKIGNGNFCP